MFRNIVYSVCCAVVVALGGVEMVEDVMGMETIVPVGETVHISDRAQFLAITPEQAKGIRDISFNGQNVDESFCEHWCTLFSGLSFNRLVFDECSFDKNSFFIFEGVIVANLMATRCGIETSQVGEILRAIDPYSIRNVDFSFNTLNNDGGNLYSILCKYVGGGRMHLNTLDLRGNSLSEFLYDTKNISRILF
jgi:hypothetical protein